MVDRGLGVSPLLVADGRKAGNTYSQPDLIIAATALHHGLTVVFARYQRF